MITLDQKLGLRMFAFCLVLVFTLTVYGDNPAVTINVDAATGRHAINPNIYGTAHASTAILQDLNIPLNRNGGNNTTRYNWQLNADNRGNDWYFESIADSSATAGERGDTFISNTKAANAQAMLTIPLIGWVAKVGNNRSKLCSFSINKYGAQTGNDWQWFADAGNGVWTNGQDVTGNDANDSSVLTDSTFEQGWAQHLVSRWGTNSNGGLRYYIMDNEPSIWHSTHRDVHPAGATMDEVKNKIVDYAGKIKATDASALVVGPEEWGWSGYFYSGYDQQYGSKYGWSNLPDRNNHGGWDYLPWVLDQLRQNNASTGKRLLDVFTVHYYPQGGEFGNDTSSSMQLRRNRSTRSLWDPNYIDETWINDKVKLVPRLRSWVNTYYPGTAIGITEYNWGAEAHINGATTQADILGIFGRENLDMGTRWTTPDSTTPTYKAMKMYRNYDGNKSAFGDTSVSDVVPNPDNVSSFAAIRGPDGALTIMVISKYLTGNTFTTLNLNNFSGNGTAQRWQLTSSNAITRLADVTYSGGNFAVTLPPQSITLFVLAASGPGNQPPVAIASAVPTSGTQPLNVSFNGSSSYDPDGSITAYNWTFGDGGSASGVQTSHTYNNAGTFAAQLSVTDNQNATSSTTVNITVNAVTVNAPSNLTGKVSAKTVTLNWIDNSNNEDGFYVERAPRGSTAFVRVGQVAANVQTFSQTVTTGWYVYRVQAFSTSLGKVSAYSNTVTLRVK